MPTLGLLKTSIWMAVLVPPSNTWAGAREGSNTGLSTAWRWLKRRFQKMSRSFPARVCRPTGLLARPPRRGDVVCLVLRLWPWTV